MKNRKVKRVGRVGTRRMAITLGIVAAFICSCSTTQRINVKQSQGDQMQETSIEHSGTLESLNLSFYNSPIINPLTANN